MLSSEYIEDKTDEELVLLVLQNQDYFLYLMRRYEGKLLTYIRRISGVPKEDAEDLLQNVFIKTYQNINDFDTYLKFSSWIYRIAHNETISNFRKLKSRPVSVSIDNEPALANKASSVEDFTKDIDRDMDVASIEKVLAKMDKKYKDVLILKFLEEKSYAEISDILQKPIGTVGALVNRGKEHFKKITNKERVNFN